MASVCYVLSYRCPDVIRTRTLLSAIEKINSIKLYKAINSSKGVLRYFETLLKLIGIRIFGNPDIYILGFRGYELYWPVRLITLGKRLIYDHMMSPYDSLVNEYRSIKSGSILERLIFFYEKITLSNPDLVLTDTEEHKKYFQTLFEVDSKKIVALPVGADEKYFSPIRDTSGSTKSDIFELLFYGSFLPLHGVDIILDAAIKLNQLPIHFTLIGGTQGNYYYQLLKQHPFNNITHIDWVEFEQLPKFISSADIGLCGPFGNTGQAHRVVSAKTMQFMAMAKPVIIGEISSDFGFKDKLNCLMVNQGNSKALAETIIWAFDHRKKIKQIGMCGFELYEDCYSLKQIISRMKEILLNE